MGVRQRVWPPRIEATGRDSHPDPKGRVKAKAASSKRIWLVWNITGSCSWAMVQKWKK